MLNYDIYAKESVGFDLTLSKMAKTIQLEITKALSQGKTIPEIKTLIYKLLSKEGLDSKAFDYIFNSISKITPISKAQYSKEFTKTKIDGKTYNLYDNIDNKASTDRITKRLDKDVGIIEARKSRLSSYKEPTDEALHDIKRSISTIKTDANSIRLQMDKNKKNMKKLTDPKVIKDLRRENYELLKTYQSTNTKFLELNKKSKDLAKIEDPMAKKRAMKSLTKEVINDIDKRKIPNTISVAVKSSIGEPIKTVATTEIQMANRKALKASTASLEKGLKPNEIILAKISLSPNRTFIGPDICDEITGADVGYGKGIYPIDSAPLPPFHPRCGCNATIIKRKKK